MEAKNELRINFNNEQLAHQKFSGIKTIVEGREDAVDNLVLDDTTIQFDMDLGEGSSEKLKIELIKNQIKYKHSFNPRGYDGTAFNSCCEVVDDVLLLFSPYEIIKSEFNYTRGEGCKYSGLVESEGHFVGNFKLTVVE